MEGDFPAIFPRYLLNFQAKSSRLSSRFSGSFSHDRAVIFRRRCTNRVVIAYVSRGCDFSDLCFVIRSAFPHVWRRRRRGREGDFPAIFQRRDLCISSVRYDDG
ncbi:hypothetical protein TIFTF001_017082 [Ficus carica]|uniref:Uncharacterized protein n=1 Tax=Ficus carica TaxID=3494 RepID=A0AA88D6Q7_FICCA|nr:hypothetical protein TIFTF001_017082 [Ficus carica]